MDGVHDVRGVGVVVVDDVRVSPIQVLDCGEKVPDSVLVVCVCVCYKDRVYVRELRTNIGKEADP